MAKLGDNYEIFVRTIFQAILDSECYGEQKNLTVERKKIICDNAGINREFDIYWEYELGGIIYKTVIECKDYSSPVSVEKIDALIGKLQDLPDIKGIFATKKGYQKGAQRKAEKNKIDLLIVREVDDSDFTLADGTPLVKNINIKIETYIPSKILSFNTILDGKWIAENLKIDPKNLPAKQSFRNDQVFIENIDTGSETSLLELLNTFVKPVAVTQDGIFEKSVQFNNAFIKYADGTKYKLVGYKVKYKTFKPITREIEINYANEFFGVVEYLFNKRRKFVGKQGTIQTDTLPQKTKK